MPPNQPFASNKSTQKLKNESVNKISIAAEVLIKIRKVLGLLKGI